METYDFDVVILGGGPAGFSAALYSARGAASTAIIDVSMLGGQPSNYLELENYPGMKKIGGFDLMEKFEEHAAMRIQERINNTWYPQHSAPHRQ